MKVENEGEIKIRLFSLIFGVLSTSPVLIIGNSLYFAFGNENNSEDQ